MNYKLILGIFVCSLLIGYASVSYVLENVNKLKSVNGDTGTPIINPEVQKFHNDIKHKDDFVFIIPAGFNTTHFSLTGELVEVNNG